MTRGIRAEAFHAWVELSAREWAAKVHNLAVWCTGAARAGKCPVGLAAILNTLELEKDFSVQRKITKLIRGIGENLGVAGLAELKSDVRGESLLRGLERGFLFFWKNKPNPEWEWADQVGQRGEASEPATVRLRSKHGPAVSRELIRKFGAPVCRIALSLWMTPAGVVRIG